MRVIAGKCRSLQLKTPKGEHTRPTLDRIKETLFNIIQRDIPGCVFADVFAGSGGIGIEALSRGARKAYFIDNSSEAINCIRENIAFTKLENESTVLKGDALSCLYDIHDEHVDIIFFDPPYDLGIEEKIFSILYSMKNIDSDTLVILESSLDKEFSFDGFELVRCKEYKTNKHGFYRRIK